MTVEAAFARWRNLKRPSNWGLAWFLANAFCRRFYSSHGIVPWVINRDGLGYYGISLNQVGCRISAKSDSALGRFTIAGNVENWTTGSPGDHGLDTEAQCKNGKPAADLVQAAIRHMDLKPNPPQSHVACRHKRWGRSYELCFELATILALRHDPYSLRIWNHPTHTERAIAQHDPHVGMSEHPGAFLFIRDQRRVLLIGDGRLVAPNFVDLWASYMDGKDVLGLVAMLEEQIDL